MKKHITIILLLIMVLSLSGCTESKSPQDNSLTKESPNLPKDDYKENKSEDNPKNEKPDAETNDIVEPTPKTESQDVILYFANPQYIETGNENLDHFVTMEKTLEFGDISIAEAIVKELMKTPQDASITTGIPSTVKLLGVEISDDTAFVNFAQEGLFGGSLQESFTISQITKSLFELNNINKVQFLVNGEKTESLMGHYDIMNPFEK